MCSEQTSIGPPASRSRLVAEASRPSRGLIDTSVVIDLDQIDAERLPNELAISALTMAELAAGPHATGDAGERARRQDRLQRAEATFDPLPFDGDCARAYGRIYAAIVATGRKARGPRAVDLLIAATSVADNLPLYTRNVEDFRGIEHLLTILGV
jgi:predicted nucleic acid-binding protein